ncbi:hypothetical protein [Paenibacillus piri]|nr:hypothetical protein [Paenibacillus piri]
MPDCNPLSQLAGKLPPMIAIGSNALHPTFGKPEKPVRGPAADGLFLS